MIKFALKGLLGRKLRTALTAIAIVLGVAMVSGTYVLTDSIDQAFDAIFNDVRAGLGCRRHREVRVRPHRRKRQRGPHARREPARPRPDAAAEVAQAEGGVDSESTVLIDKEGKAIVGNAPSIGFSIANGNSPFNPLRLVEGGWPRANEIVIDEATAEEGGLQRRRHDQRAGGGRRPAVPHLGLVRFGDTLSTIGDATLAGFDLPTAQRLYNKEGRLDEIAVSSHPNVSAEELTARDRGRAPADRRRSEQARRRRARKRPRTNEFITFLQGFLLAFAGIALFVGSFVIANSLAITIAQRTREFATLRTIGASRKQVLGSIILEALVVGILASVVGLFLGLGLATVLFKLFDAVGFTLPNTGLVFQTRTIVVALLVGILVTLLASLRPAIRATRVPPIAAVREGATLPRVALRAVPHGRRLAAQPHRFRCDPLRAVRPRPRDDETCSLARARAPCSSSWASRCFAVKFIRPLAYALGWPSTKIGGAPGALRADNASETRSGPLDGGSR